MKDKMILAGILIFSLALSASTDAQLMDRFLDGIASEDVLSDEEPVYATIGVDYPGIRHHFAVSNDTVFLNLLRDRVVGSSADASTITNADEKLRLSVGMMLLYRYDLTNSLPSYANIVTNGVCVDMVSECAFYLGYGLGVSTNLLDFLKSDGFSMMEVCRVEEFYDGMFRGLNARYVKAGMTNKVLSVALGCLNEMGAWKQADFETRFLWPEYATSSNRYLAAQRALQIVPPPASSNRKISPTKRRLTVPPVAMRLVPRKRFPK